VKAVLRAGYGVYCWSVFVPLALAALVVALPVPGVERRRRIVRRGARLFLALAGLRVTVLGLERLPAGPCVVVANHASYLDGVLMQAVLPPRFAFVIKREIVRVPLASLLLRRIGSEFVERFDRHKGAIDARRLLRAAGAGQSLAFFPEGTFSARVGLARFHAGAFVAAARAAVPVVAVVIRGARAVLPPEGLLPRRADLEVELLEILPAAAAGETQAAARLRAAARAAILAGLGEPDLE
jgi:1-acyl-sn-glycerol-3-phosphate acyltransferase